MTTVRLLGGLRDKLGAASLDVEGTRVREVLDALVERAGPELGALFYADPAAERPVAGRDLRVLVNGRGMQFLDGLETELAAGDAVTVHLSGARGWPGG
jgi:molybdopterin converting factor small subunit